MKDAKTMAAPMEQYDVTHDVWHQIVVPGSIAPPRVFQCAVSFSP